MGKMTVVLAEGYVATGRFGAEWTPEAEYWIDGEPITVEITAEDENIRVGVMLPDSNQEVVGFYFSPSSARDLIVGLGGAIRDLETR